MTHLHYDYYNIFNEDFNPKILKKFLIGIGVFILIILTLTSCGSSKSTYKKYSNDSVVYVEKLFHDTIILKEKEIVSEPVYNEVQIPCDSTYFATKYSSGGVKYKIIKEKGEVKVIFEKDSLRQFEKVLYHKAIRERDSLTKVNKSFVDKTEVKTSSFWCVFWKWLFWIIFVLWVLNITPKYLIDIILSKFNK